LKDEIDNRETGSHPHENKHADTEISADGYLDIVGRKDCAEDEKHGCCDTTGDDKEGSAEERDETDKTGPPAGVDR